MLGSMVNILWSRPPADRAHRLRTVQATPVPEFAPAFEARFGVRFISGFGLTDFGASRAWMLLHPADKLGSCGTVRRGIEARVVDANDFDVPTGEVGELVLRSDHPWESGGYYRNPEATLAAWRKGWFHTGDLGIIDADGCFWFADRGKDSIRRRGENISAFEVEQAILAHPEMADAAAAAR